MATTEQTEDLQAWVADLRADADAARGDLEQVRALVGDPEVAMVAQALQAAAVTYGPVRVAQLQCLDDACFARCAEYRMAGFWRALAAAAIGAMGDSMPETALSAIQTDAGTSTHARACPQDPIPATGLSEATEEPGGHQ